MEQLRGRYEGVRNIVRFNWHFYIAAFIIVLTLTVAAFYNSTGIRWIPAIIALLVFIIVISSLLVSFYVYDISGLYKLGWLDMQGSGSEQHFVNVHAGFDETSLLIKQKFPGANLEVYDFYDPVKHTEVSIKRARKYSAAFPGTLQVSTAKLPATAKTASHIFLLFAAHEIREESERKQFFRELNRILKDDGQVIITEHLRDLPNFLAYNIGFFHFLKKRSWYSTFQSGGFVLIKEKKIAKFITMFTLQKNGTSS